MHHAWDTSALWAQSTFQTCTNCIHKLCKHKLWIWWRRNHLCYFAPFIQAYDHDVSGVRKACVFCLVAIHSVIGDELKVYLEQLSTSKVSSICWTQLLWIYFTVLFLHLNLCFLQSYDHAESSIRKASVFCLVAIHGVIGEQLKIYLSDLPGSKVGYINQSINRFATVCIYSTYQCVL